MKDKPKWCPFADCIMIRNTQNMMCCGKLPVPDPHLDDFNTHRFCLNLSEFNEPPFELKINRTDAHLFRALFDAVYNDCGDPKEYYENLNKLKESPQH
jgi:hypothetical protein